jgi:hypothetical protein
VLPGTAGAAILFDQIDPTPPESTSSQDFEAVFDTSDTLGADDFVVPPGEVWQLSTALLDGFKVGATSTSTFNVHLYANAGALPGAEVFSASVQASQASAYPDRTLLLDGAPVLPAGTWWFAPQARLDGVNPGDPQQWFWSESDTGAGSIAVWRNPGDAFGTDCTEFTPRPECPLFPPGGGPATSHPAPGQSFRIEGTSAPAEFEATKLKPGKKGKLAITVNAPNVGTLEATSKQLKPLSVEVGEPGPVTLNLKPAKKTKRKLADDKKVKATVALSLPPLFDGTALAASAKKKLKG